MPTGLRTPTQLPPAARDCAAVAVVRDLHCPGRELVISLQHEQYSKLVVDVEDPEQAVAEIRQAIAS